MQYRKAVLAVMLSSTLCACAAPHVTRYEQGVADNYRKLQTLKLGMTRAQVDELMGQNHPVDYKRVQLRNPWRTEAFRINKDTDVEVYFYVTQGLVWQGRDDNKSLTPVIFENGVVAGWGWTFLDRYRGRPAAAPTPARAAAAPAPPQTVK